MDELDKRLLNVIQAGFPISPRPYRVLGERLGMTEEEALSRTRALVDSGIIRRIGPSFDSRKLGHTSTLVAAKIPGERLRGVAEIVSSFPQVTHNYSRDHECNLWFTLICHDAAEIERVVSEIKARTGMSDVHVLPAEQMFKVKVRFEL